MYQSKQYFQQNAAGTFDHIFEQGSRAHGVRLRNKAGSSFSSNFNARRAFFNTKYAMRHIHQRSFDEFVPSGMMPKDMRIKLPNIPGITEKTVSQVLNRSSVDEHLLGRRGPIAK